MNQFGGSQRTAMKSRSDSLTDITAAADMPMAGSLNCSAAPAKNLSSELGIATPSGFGGDSKTTADKQALIVPFSAMKAPISPASLSDRLTPSLISAGLVCGIIPLSMRDASGQQTLDSVLKPQAGRSVEQPKVDL